MATGHHQCHCHSNHLPPPATTCYCTMCCTTTHYSSPPPFHSISSHLHHHPPPQNHLHAPPQIHHNIHAPPQNHQHHDYSSSSPPPPSATSQIHQKHQLFQKYRQQEEDEENSSPPVTPTVSSLIHRIAALESSLRRRKGSPRSSSLRDAAARTIQTHFRAFLVRRSVTLRNLKDLAYIKSSLNNLKSSVSDKIHFDSQLLSRESMNLLIKLDSIQGLNDLKSFVSDKIHFHSQLLSRESMNLLIKLDSIQGSDPMIRDGKRSISRELIRFMEFIDEMPTENHVISVKNVRFSKNGKKSVILQREQKIRASGSRVLGGDNDIERKFPQNSNNQTKKNVRVSSVSKVEEEVELENPKKPQNRFGGLMKNQPKGKKTVSFSENGNVYRLIKSSHSHASSDETDSSNDGEEEEVDEIGVSSKEPEVEDEDSSEMSENEMDPRKNLGTRMNHSTKKHQFDQEHNDEDEDDEGVDDDSFVFSAPLPEKMEYRVDSNKKQTGKQ